MLLVLGIECTTNLTPCKLALDTTKTQGILFYSQYKMADYGPLYRPVYSTYKKVNTAIENEAA